MRQLTGLDAQFLAMESPRQSGHVSMLMTVDPRTRPGGKLEYDDVVALVKSRLPLLPPFRWRLRKVPFGLDYPYWYDDPDFDLEYHIRELAVPANATPQKISEQVARITSRPLDRSRPLWELYVVQGLPDGQVGIVTKVHHAAVDGISGAEILSAVLDLGPEGRGDPDPEPAPREPEPTDLAMLARGLAAWPNYLARIATGLPTTLPNLEDTPLVAIPGAKSVGRASARLVRAIQRQPHRVLERPTLEPPLTSFNGRVSGHRRLAYGQLPLDTIKKIKAEYGCTVNDVIVSVCAGAVRRWLIAHEQLPDGPLVAQIPVSVRTDAQFGTYGNRIGVISAPLHTEEPDPVKRLMQTHEDMRALKERHKALPATLLQDTAHFIPPALFAQAARVTTSLATRKPLWNLVVSNVPGPQFPLYFDGAEVTGLYPISIITDSMGLNITLFSYCGHVDFGIVVDREQVPDVWNVATWLDEALAELT